MSSDSIIPVEPEKKGCWASFVCCPPGCALCGIGFSIWGVITLIIVGLMLDTNYQLFIVEEICPDELHSRAVNCYIAAAIYAVIAVLSGIRLWWFSRKSYEQL